MAKLFTNCTVPSGIRPCGISLPRELNFDMSSENVIASLKPYRACIALGASEFKQDLSQYRERVWEEAADFVQRCSITSAALYLRKLSRRDYDYYHSGGCKSSLAKRIAIENVAYGNIKFISDVYIAFVAVADAEQATMAKLITN